MRLQFKWLCILCIYLQGFLVYVNYGTIDDFLYLTENLSLSLNERVCIARYGHIYRGDKVCVFLLSWDHSLMQEDCQVAIFVHIMGITAWVQFCMSQFHSSWVWLCSILYTTPQAKLAQYYGCSGLIIYSDPAEFAPKGGLPVYPNGPNLPPGGVQRGSLLISDGDPLTPGIPAIR